MSQMKQKQDIQQKMHSTVEKLVAELSNTNALVTNQAKDLYDVKEKQKEKPESRASPAKKKSSSLPANKRPISPPEPSSEPPPKRLATESRKAELDALANKQKNKKK